MSDSDSELSLAPAIPSDATLEKSLRDAVDKVFKTDNRDDLTVKRMRIATEKALDLPEGFFKGDVRWKGESERIIREEAVRGLSFVSEQLIAKFLSGLQEKQEAKQEGKAGSEKDEETPVKVKPKKSPPKSKEDKKPKENSKPKKKPKTKEKIAKPPKRASSDESDVDSKPSKRQKTAVSDESKDELSSPPSNLSEEPRKELKKAPKAAGKGDRGRPKSQSKAKMDTKVDDSDEEEDPKPKKSKAKKVTKGVDSDEDEEPESKESKEAKKSDSEESTHEEPEKTNGVAKVANSQSELSEVLDPSPKPKRKKRKSSEGSSKAEKKPRKTSKVKDDSNLPPDEAEIKRLQGWLIKCGIRKMWFRELAPYETPKAKIRHLKGMLKDAGMDGRYSIEKANQIKEERELKADLDMVQEGAKRWGADSDKDEVDDKGRPKRRLARGLRDVADFLGSDDGEETS
jgi:hypothetical protein